MTSGIPALPGLADLSPLGRGGLADVYLGKQLHLERWVAAKVFRVTLADEQAADRFRAECRALGRIDQYPDIITVYDAGVLPDGRPYLISERCAGSLADLVEAQGPLPDDRVAAIGLPVARALRFAHSAGVLHGDVTPQNVLLRAGGAPVLADFGLAVLRDVRDRTAAGFTMAHAAPEAFEAGGPIDERADVYGLGSTLYTALTARPPFPRHPGEDDRDRAERIRTEPVDPPPGRLADLLVAMLAKRPADRPGTDEVVHALGGDPAGAPTRWIPAEAPVEPAAGAATSATSALPPGERTRLQRDPAPARPPSRRTPLIVGVLALLLAVGGVAFALTRTPEPAGPGPAAPAAVTTPPPPPATTVPPTGSPARPTATSEPGPTARRRTVTRTRAPAPAPGGGAPTAGDRIPAPTTPAAPPAAPRSAGPSASSPAPGPGSEDRQAPRLRAPSETRDDGDAGARSQVGPDPATRQPAAAPGAADASGPAAGPA